MHAQRTVPIAITRPVSRAALVALAALTLVGCAGPPQLEAPASVEVAEGRTARFALTLEPDAELTIVSSAPDEIVAVRDGDDVVVTARLGALAGTVTLIATNERGETEASVDVNVAPLAFTRVEWTGAAGPEAREHGAMFTSEDGATVYVLQGGGYPNVPTQEVIGDAWQLDVDSGAWSEWSVSGDVPAAAGSRRAAQAGSVGYLFGGYDGDFVGNDELYRVDLASGVFTRITATNEGPPQRSLHAFAFDAERDQVIVYGGFFSDAGGAQDILGDTWIGALDGDSVTWSEVSGGPLARYGMFAGLDEGLGRFVVWSGAGFPVQGDPINAFEDVWLLDLASGAPAWREIVPGGEVPAGRRNGCGVVDPVTHGLFVFGGTSDGATTEPGVFALDLEREAWVELARDGEPPLRSSSFGVAVPGGGIVCGMGNDAATYQDVFWLR